MEHLNDDADRGPYALHHTLGKLPAQAAPGNHTTHNLGTLTGSKASGAALNSVIAMLVKLGAIDNTTA